MLMAKKNQRNVVQRGLYSYKQRYAPSKFVVTKFGQNLSWTHSAAPRESTQHFDQYIAIQIHDALNSLKVMTYYTKLQHDPFILQFHL